MKITIKEIAELAGVHRATVDKVLHGREGVSDEVRARVQRIIREQGYTPNPAGRVLQRQGQRYRLAVLLVEVDALPILRQGVQVGVQEQIGFEIATEYHICAFGDAAGQAAALDEAVASGVSGVIISPINAPCVRAAIDRAAAAGVPVVTTNTDMEGSRRLCYVGLDGARASRVAGRLMGQFLGGAGKVAVVSSALDQQNNNADVGVRERGFTEFIKRTFPEIEIAACVDGREDPALTYRRTLDMLRVQPALNGLYVAGGGAAEAGRALQDSGRAAQIRMLTYEDYPAVLELLRRDVIDCTLAGELQRQGSLPVQLLMEQLVFGKAPPCERIFTEMQILVKESVF